MWYKSEMETIGKEVATAYLKVLSQQSSGRTGKPWENLDQDIQCSGSN